MVMERFLRWLLPFFISRPLALGTTTMLVMSVISLLGFLPSYIERDLYLSHGVEADATVIRKPEACGRYKRYGSPYCVVTYRYANPSGKGYFEWTDSINSDLWPSLTVGSAIRIVYLDFAPSFSQATELRVLTRAAGIIMNSYLFEVIIFLFSAASTWIMYMKYKHANVNTLLSQEVYDVFMSAALSIPTKFPPLTKEMKRGLYLLALALALGVFSSFFSPYGNVQPVLLIWTAIAGMLALISMKQKS